MIIYAALRNYIGPLAKKPKWHICLISSLFCYTISQMSKKCMQEGSPTAPRGIIILILTAMEGAKAQNFSNKTACLFLKGMPWKWEIFDPEKSPSSDFQDWAGNKGGPLSSHPRPKARGGVSHTAIAKRSSRQRRERVCRCNSPRFRRWYRLNLPILIDSVIVTIDKGCRWNILRYYNGVI